MAYLLDGTTIRSPHEIEEVNDKQVAQNRTLDGSINRDFFGSRKRTWRLIYRNTKAADYAAIKTIYDAYQVDATTKTFESTEPNYTISSTLVHIDLLERAFRIRGTDYLSDFDLILTEE